jgi:hypothetical protein
VSKKTRKLHRGGNPIPPLVPLPVATDVEGQSFLDTTTRSLGGTSNLNSNALVFQPTDPSEPGSVPALMKVKNALNLKKLG